MAKFIFTLYFIGLTFLLYAQDYQIVWQQCFGGTEPDIPHDIIKLQDGFLIAGGTGSADGDISFNHGSSDVWVIKVDFFGNILWERTYGGSSGESVKRIIKNNEGDYYLLGNTGSSDGDVSYDPYPDNTDYWIIKIDSLGNIIWDRVIGGVPWEFLNTGIVTDDGGVIALGHIGSIGGDVSAYYGLSDIWMIKIDSDGEIEWDFTIGTNGQDFSGDVIQTNDGGYLVGGSSSIETGGNLICHPFNYNAEAVLVKLDSARNIEWQNCYGGSGHDGIWKLKELSDGYVLVGYGSSNDGDLIGSGWHGEGDIWVIKTDFFGTIIWQKCLGGYRSEYSNIVFKTNNDEFIIAGSTRSNNGDVSGNHSLSEYDHDIWMIKLSSEGELLSQQCIGGAGDEDVNFGVVKKSDNNFVIAAQTDYGPSYDVGCTPHGGNGVDSDFWVFQIKDCSYYAPGIPAAPTGPDTVCSVGGQQDLYAIPPATKAWYYEWLVEPEEAGTVTGDSLTATISWTEGFEGTASLIVRSINDCGQSQWSQPKYVEAVACVGVNEITGDGIKIRVYPNPAQGFVIFELPGIAQLKNAVVQNSVVIQNNGVIPTEGSMPAGKAGNPPTTSRNPGKYEATGKHKSTGNARNSQGVSHSSAQGQPGGFDMTAPDEASVTIVNVYGQQVAKLPIVSEKTLWHTGEVENGVYFYRFEVDGDVLSGKVVVQK